MAAAPAVMFIAASFAAVDAVRNLGGRGLWIVRDRAIEAEISRRTERTRSVRTVCSHAEHGNKFK